MKLGTHTQCHVINISPPPFYKDFEIHGRGSIPKKTLFLHDIDNKHGYQIPYKLRVPSITIIHVCLITIVVLWLFILNTYENTLELSYALKLGVILVLDLKSRIFLALSLVMHFSETIQNKMASITMSGNPP